MAASAEMLKKTSTLSVALTIGSLMIGGKAEAPKRVDRTSNPLYVEAVFPGTGEGNITEQMQAAGNAILRARAEKRRRERQRQHEIELRKQREAQQAAVAQAASSPTVTAGNSGCGDNPSAQFIYQHESGCDPTAENAGGCLGIGQDCNGQLRSACPNLDYACENQFFTNYAMSRYGSWEAAEAFWRSNNWW